MGLGDVASILIPAVKIIQSQHQQAKIDVLTYVAGVELMTLVQDVDSILAVTAEQWPSDIDEAISSFTNIADVVIEQNYDLIVNLDTWFMPCFLASVLKEAGLNVQGNTINLTIDDLLQKIRSNTLTQFYFQNPNQYLDSTYSSMADWTTPWWYQHSNTPYPEFYLNHCCGFKGIVDISLYAEADFEFKQQANGRKIVALSLSGSKASKQYHEAKALRARLEEAGFFVWSQFDGSVSMQTTLGRLKVTDLLITVATSTQWLARLVECPSLMIPGALPPSVLGAELVVEKIQHCQYCYQKQCVENLNFACMNISPVHILEKVSEYFNSSK